MKKTGPLDLAVLWGGVGDGRHFFQQLGHLESYYSTLPKKATEDETKDKFTFVLQDIKAHCLAWLLVELKIMHEIGQITDEEAKTEEGERKLIELEATVTYIFMADLMPPWAYKRLRDTMQSLIDHPTSESENTTFGVPWIVVPAVSIEPIKTVFRAWLKDNDGILKLHGVDRVLKSRVTEPKIPEDKNEMELVMMSAGQDFFIFSNTKIVSPPLAVASYEPELSKLLAKVKDSTDVPSGGPKKYHYLKPAVRFYHQI